VNKDTKEIFVPELSLSVDSLNKALSLYGLRANPIEQVKPVTENKNNNERPIEKVGFSFYNSTMDKNTWLEYFKPLGNSLYEDITNKKDSKDILIKFLLFAVRYLKLNGPYPKILLTTDKTKTPTYGHYDPSNNTIVAYTLNRSMGDILRTIAHELVHRKQQSLGQLGPDSGATGSSEENEANSVAGIMLRNFGKEYPQIFE
jgi:hypothetical protein